MQIDYKRKEGLKKTHQMQTHILTHLICSGKELWMGVWCLGGAHQGCRLALGFAVCLSTHRKRKLGYLTVYHNAFGMAILPSTQSQNMGLLQLDPTATLILVKPTAESFTKHRDRTRISFLIFFASYPVSALWVSREKKKTWAFRKIKCLIDPVLFSF